MHHGFDMIVHLFPMAISAIDYVLKFEFSAEPSSIIAILSASIFDFSPDFQNEFGQFSKCMPLLELSSKLNSFFQICS